MLLEKPAELHTLTKDQIEQLSYRCPAKVQKIRVFRGHQGLTSYSVCPKCDSSLEREYQSFCDRCGQRLDWKSLRKAQIIKMW